MKSREATGGDWAGWADGSHDSAYEVLGAHPADDDAADDTEAAADVQDASDDADTDDAKPEAAASAEGEDDAAG